MKVGIFTELSFVWQFFAAAKGTQLSGKFKKQVEMMKKSLIILAALVMVLTGVMSGCKNDSAETIRIGFFPNLTHSQAVYGYANGDFAKAFGKDVSLKWLSFNSGPSEIEAMFAGEVDIGYIGPIPAINGYIKSSGDVKIISGATLNGALLVTRKGLKIDQVKGLDGYTVAVPQFGNTQHLCLLNLLSVNGLKTVEKGGKVKIVESSNPDIKTLMDKGDVDAALVPEPWATRLVKEIGANILLNSDQIWDAGDYATTVIVVNTDFYEKNKQLVETFLKTHVEITAYINKNPEQAMKKINDKIGELTGSKLDETVLSDAFSNLIVTYDPNVSSVNKFMDIYREEGFVDEIQNKEGIYDFTVLNSILKEKSLQEIS